MRLMGLGNGVAALGVVVLAVVCFVSQGSPSQTLTAKVTFMDGGDLDVKNFRFVYEYAKTSDRKYINPPTEKRSSTDLHYREVIRSVTLDRRVAINDLAKLTLRYRDSDLCSPSSISVTTREGKSTTISLLSVPPAASDSSADPPSLWALYLEGTAVVAGSEGRFSGRLWFDGTGGCLEAREAPKEIVFQPAP